MLQPVPTVEPYPDPETLFRALGVDEGEHADEQAHGEADAGQQGSAVADAKGQPRPEGDRGAHGGVEQLHCGVEGQEPGDHGVAAGGHLDPDNSDEDKDRLQLARKQRAQRQAERHRDEAGQDHPGEHLRRVAGAGACDHGC